MTKKPIVQQEYEKLPFWQKVLMNMSNRNFERFAWKVTTGNLEKSLNTQKALVEDVMAEYEAATNLIEKLALHPALNHGRTGLYFRAEDQIWLYRGKPLPQDQSDVLSAVFPLHHNPKDKT